MDEITHIGTITDGGSGWVLVQLDAEATNCAGCTLHGHCSESAAVRVSFSGNGSFEKGRRATVRSHVGSERVAVVVFFGLPLACCLVCGLLAAAFGLGDGAIAAGGLLGMAACFAAEWLLRGRWADKHEFRLVCIE